MKLAQAQLYFHTLRSLRPAQVLGRVWRAVHTVRPDLSPAPALRAARGWCEPAAREASWLSATRRRFLSVERDVTGAADWNTPDSSKLWLYNLHYFDDLAAEGAASRVTWHRGEIARWIEENPPGAGNGWEAYPLSLRLVNWIKWSLAGNPLGDAAVHSLAVQARFLRASLEHHLLGNHIFANAKALVFAGLFFEGPEADAWLEKGLTLVAREVEEQVLFDGGHFERSPMYHSLFLEDLLDLLNLEASCPGALRGRWSGQPAQWRSTARRMRRWLTLMTHPDGELALFNDCAFGVAPAPDRLHGYARRLGLGPTPLPRAGVQLLPHSGYVRLENEDALALLDVGEIGPSYLPGHAHADSLGFELSLFGERTIVDSGTSDYAASSERLRQRGTAAHNTITVDGQDSSEVWSSFRVARRAEPHELEVDESSSELVVRCGHDGYLRLPGRVVHSRRWTLGAHTLELDDRLDGAFRSAEAAFHLHPAVRPLAADRFALPGAHPLSATFVGGTPSAAPSTWHPRFGASIPNTRVAVALQGRHLQSTFRW